MKILNISNKDLWPLGINRGIPSVFYPQKEFAAAGHDVVFLTYVKEKSAKIEEAYEGIAVKRFKMPFTLGYLAHYRLKKDTVLGRVKVNLLYNLEWLFFQLYALWHGLRAARVFRPDIVYAHSLTSVLPAFLISRRCKAKLVVRVYGVRQLYQKRKNNFYRLKEWRDYLMFKIPADLWITTRDGTGAAELAIESGIPPKKILDLRNGVDSALFETITKDTAAIRRRLGIPADGKIVLSTSMLMPFYRIDAVINLFPVLFQNDATAVMVIAGDGPEKDRLRKLVAGLGLGRRVIFTGVLDHASINDLLCCADIFLYLSNIHSGANVIWEAMAAGKCIVASQTRNTGEIFTAGETAVILSDAEISQPPQILTTILGDDALRNRMGNNARGRAKELLTTWHERASAELTRLESLAKAPAFSAKPDPSKFFIKHFYYPLTMRIKGEKAFDYLKDLEQSQSLPRSLLQAQNEEKLRCIVSIAGQNVPYYRDLFKQREVDFQTGRFYDEFKKIPLLTKDILRARRADFFNKSYRGNTYRVRTSGSTGKAVETWHTIDEWSWILAAQWRFKRWFGVEIGDREVAVWGRPFEGYVDRYLGPLKTRVRNTMLVPGFYLSPDSLEKYYRKIAAFRPDYLYGYSSSLYKLAEYIQKRYGKASFRPKVVIPTGETLFDNYRRTIAQAFACPVAQEYGCSEIGAFAYECEQGVMHIAQENVIVEFLNNGVPAAAGESGEVVVTSLRNQYTPFIRYALGDIGVPLDRPCSCGRTMATADLKIAKITDIIKTSRGKLFSTQVFDYINLELIKNKITGISQFKITQERIDAFLVEVVKDEPFNEQSINYFVEKMKDTLGRENTISVKYVPAIVPEPSGKIRYFVSKVNG